MPRPAVLAAQQDTDDDVRAASADALLPTTDCIVANCPGELRGILTILWDALLDLDDLTASTSSVLKLLASLLQHITSLEGDKGIENTHNEGTPLAELVPRLWPFFRHTLASVRRSALQTFQKIFLSGHSAGVTAWIPDVLSDALTHL